MNPFRKRLKIDSNAILRTLKKMGLVLMAEREPSSVEFHHNRPYDRLNGVTPTVANWDNDPTNLANATDNDWAVATGIGNTVLGAPGEIGRWLFDMGAIYNVDIRAKILTGNNIGGGGTDNIALEGSEDDITFYSFIGSYSLVYLWTANYNQVLFAHGFVRARYLRIIHTGDTAGTCYGAIYEIEAVELDVGG